MASNTPNLNLYKKDPVADGNDTFNIQTMLNENWDKIDTSVANKVDKVPGKGLSTNDYTDEDKQKVSSALQSSEVAANGANKIPRLNEQGKGDFSITGDAASVGGQTLANLDTRFVKTANMDLGALQVRINNGQWEINDGTGWKSMSAVKSVQRGTTTLPVTLPNAAVLADVTISPVTLSKTTINITYTRTTTSTANGARSLDVMGRLTSNTNLELSAFSGFGGDQYVVSWEVIEFV